MIARVDHGAEPRPSQDEILGKYLDINGHFYLSYPLETRAKVWSSRALSAGQPTLNQLDVGPRSAAVQETAKGSDQGTARTGEGDFGSKALEPRPVGPNTLETFHWRGRDYQLETSWWKGQRLFKCPLCQYEKYELEEVLLHRSAPEHRHDFYRQEKHWEMEKFWREGHQVFKCQACRFESPAPLDVAEHYSAEHEVRPPNSEPTIVGQLQAQTVKALGGTADELAVKLARAINAPRKAETLMNLTDRQMGFLRRLVANHESTGGVEFFFVQSMSSGIGLTYQGGLRCPAEGDETDLLRLQRENLVDVTRVDKYVHRGKPTQFGITAVHNSLADELPQQAGRAGVARPRQNLDPADRQPHEPTGPNAPSEGCEMPVINGGASPELPLEEDSGEGSPATAADPAPMAQQQPENPAGDRGPAKVYKTATGRNIDRLRKECGWSFDALAEKTGIDKKLTLGHVNEGKGAHPSTLKTYADAFSKGLNRPVTVAELEG
jgi:hypothetical protein